MRPSNRQHKYSWEEEDLSSRRRPPAVAPDFEADEDEEVAGTRAGPKKARRPVRDRQPERRRKSAGPPRRKKAGAGPMLLRVGLFLLVVGGVGALAASGVFTVGGETETATTDASVEAASESEPRREDVSTPPDFGSTFAGLPEVPDENKEPEVPPTPEPMPVKAFDATLEAPSGEERVASLPPEAAEPPPEPEPQTLQLDPAEIRALRTRGEEMIAQGNIGQARLFLERAMRGGDGGATFLLARTYDPNALTEWGVLNMKPDPARATELYARARELGVDGSTR